MKIQIRPYENFDEVEIVELYSSVGWTAYAAAPDMLKRAYAGEMCVLGVYDGEKLVGIVRAVGDGASIKKKKQGSLKQAAFCMMNAMP